MACSDQEFVSYVKRKRQDYDEGIFVTEDKLMEVAENFYTRKMEDGSWNEPTEDQKRIIALTAQITKSETTVRKDKAKPRDNKGKQANKNGKKEYELPKWKTTPPKGDQPKTKVVDKRTYHWCHKHKMWTMHKPEDCRKSSKPPAKTTTEKSESNEAEVQKNTNLRVSQALSAILQGEE
jgi:hypothetical protein